MKITIVGGIILICSLSAHAEKEEQNIQMLCTGKGHMARATQEVRQQTGDDWIEFNVNAKKTHKIDEGLLMLLGIADFIYHYVPIEMSATEVYERVINACAIEMMDDSTIKFSL